MDNQNFAEPHNWEKKKKIIRIFLPALIIFLLLAGFNYLTKAITEIKSWENISQNNRSVSFTETGEIYAKPDLAIVSFSVVVEKKTVAEAMAENTKKMNAVINSVKSQGVEEKDLKTTSFNIYPRYEYPRTQTEIYPYPSGQRVLVGYEVSQRLEVKIRDLAKIGQIIEGATKAGANEVGDLIFTIDKEDELKAQAREQAINKAKAKAKELSQQLGVKLVKIINFSESGNFPIYDYAKSSLGIGGGEAVPAPQIQTGENKITVTVTITYEID
jgi:hypothetical protein